MTTPLTAAQLRVLQTEQAQAVIDKVIELQGLIDGLSEVEAEGELLFWTGVPVELTNLSASSGHHAALIRQRFSIPAPGA